MDLNCENFDYYRCDEPMIVGLSLSNLHKIFGAFSAGSVTLTCEDKESDVIRFCFEDERNHKIQNYELRQMDLENDQLGIPDPEYDATFTLHSQEFSRVVKDLINISESCTIAVTKGQVNFRAEGELGKVNITISKKDADKKVKKSKNQKSKSKNEDKSKKTSDADEEKEDNSDNNDKDEALVEFDSEDSEPDTKNNLEIQVKEPIELSFSTQYLKKFTAAGPLSEFVTCSLSKDIPMVVNYEIENLGHLKYFLAPKVEDDEDDDE